MNTNRGAYGPREVQATPAPGPRALSWFALALFLIAAWGGRAQDCPTEVEVLQPISCSGADDGVITVSFPDGVDSEDIFWLIESDTLFGAVQSDLGPGSYVAIIPGCSAVGVNLTEPFTFFITSAVTQLPTCDDPCSGQVTVTPNFGAAPIVYSWSHDAVESGPVGTGICEQVVLVSATDANGCFDQDIVTVEIPPVEALAFGTSPSCNGSADGTVSAVATGGLGGGFAFSWTDGAGTAVGNGADLTGLTAGTYTVTAVDTGGCSMTADVTLEDPAPVNVAVTTEGVSCNGDADGTATTVVSDAILYEWSGPDGFAASGPALSALTDLAPGTYTVTVTASDGCQGVGTGLVPEPDVLSADPFAAPPSCPGLSDGTAGAVMTGGTGPYSVTWTLPSGEEASGEFLNGVPAGSYAFSVVDANGCTTAGSVDLIDPAPVTVELDLTPPTCAEGDGAESGSIVATVTGGVEPYAAVWVDVSTETVIGSGLSLLNVGAGTYGFGVSDPLGCSVDTVVALLAPDSLVLTVDGVDPSCFGLPDGSVEATVEGGTPGHTVIWFDGSSTSFGPTLSDLGPGTYTATATDANGCMVESAVVLEEPEALTAMAESQPVGCAGDDGAATVEVSGGTPEVTVVWTGPQGPAGEGTLIEGLIPGTYTASVTDANGCSVDASAEVMVLPPVVLSAEWSVVNCETGAAQLTASAEGGEAPLTLDLQGPSGTVDAADWVSLPPGEYTLTATDARGCMADTSWTVLPALTLTLDVTPPGCAGPGSIEATAGGGTGAFTFSSDEAGVPDASTDSSAAWTAVMEGAYTVSVEDGVCTAMETVLLDGVDLFEWTVAWVDYACEASPGAVTVSTEGGAEPLVLSGSASDGSVTWSSLDTTGLPAGTYALSVTDALGCQRDTTFDLLAVDPLSLSVDVTPITCAESGDGVIDLEATGGTAPLTFGADGPEGLIPTPLVGLGPGTYVAGVIDGRGCAVDSVVVLVDPEPIVVETSAQDESCGGTGDGSASVSASGGTGALTVEWADGPVSPDWTGLDAGVYGWLVTDEAGCTAEGTVEVEAGESLDIAVVAGLDTCLAGVSTGSVSLVLDGPGEAATVLLGGLPADASGLSDTLSIWTWSGLTAGTYGWTATLGGVCDTSGQAIVELPNPLGWVGTVTPPVCSGDSGVVSGITTGGTPPFSALWSGTTTTGEALSGGGFDPVQLPAGTYTFSYSDPNGCALDTVIDLVPASVDLALSADVVQPTCGGALVGEATLLPTGGAPPYSVVVDGAADSLFLPFLVTGTYPLTLTDSLGCQVEDTLVIEPASDFTLIAVVDSATCANSEDGLILLETQGGTGDAEFTFVGPFGAVPAGDSIPDVGAGVYEITALDEAGCPAVLLVSVGAPPPLVIGLDTLDRPSCAGDLDGTVAVTVSGGTGTEYDIAWSEGGVPVGTGAVLDGIGEGQYAVTAEDEAGCTGSIASIPVVAEGDVTLTVPADTALCAGQALELTAVADGATDLSWILPGGATGPGLSSAVAAVSEGPSYWVFLASRLSCVRQDSVEVTGLALPQPDAGPDQIVPEGSATNIGSAPTADWTYAWDPAFDVELPEASATPTIPLQATTDFILTATNLEGCSGSDTVRVEVLLNLDIPSGFTPNADGINDRWNLGGLDQYPSAQITVFNRWGNVLLTMGATEGSWDGTLDGIPVPVGTYYYHIRVDEPALQAEWTGPITLMR